MSLSLKIPNEVYPLVSSVHPDSNNEGIVNDGSNTIGSNTYIKPWTFNRTSVSSVIFSSRRKDKSNKNKYSFFLGFTDPKHRSSKIARDYVAFKRSDSNVTYILFVLLVILVYLAIHKKDIYHVFQRSIRDDDYSPFIGQLFALITVFFIGLIFLQRLMILLPESLLSYIFKSSCCSCVSNMLNFDSTYHAIRVLEDGVIILGALSVGLKLQAHERLYLSSLQPMNDNLLFFLLNMIIVLLCQVMVKGGSRIALFLGWTIVVIFMNHIYYASSSTSQLSWINIILLSLMSISFDIERQNLRRFINSIETVNLELELANRKIREGEQSLHDKCSVVRHVSHEVRTPLNTAAVGAEILEMELAALTQELSDKGITMPPLPLEIVKGIRDACGSALEVVNELLTFEKIAAGLMTLDVAPIPIFEFLQNAAKLQFLPALAKDIVFNFYIPRRYVPIFT